MTEKSKAIILWSAIITALILLFYFGCKDQKELKNYGAYTIGITYEENHGRSTTIRYFYKTPNGIYTGVQNADQGQAPGYYYSVIFSTKNPALSEMSYDTLFPDSIGKKHIKFDEISHSTVVNGEDWR
jgi:hypothetical protein